MTQSPLLDIESHASLEHDIWASWMLYMFTRGEFNPDGSWTMPKLFVDRWSRQMITPYSELTEQERKSDIEQVVKHNNLIIRDRRYWIDEETPSEHKPG